MASLPNTRTVTYEEWLAMPEVQDAIEEVVNGEIRIMPPPKMNHQWIIRRLERAFDGQVDHTRVAVFGIQICLVIREKPLVTRIPDLAVFAVETMVEKDGYLHSPPQLVVEVLSPANRVRQFEEKLADYAKFGVPEVWVFSPESRNVEVLLLQDGRYIRSQLLAAGILQPKLFPHVHVDIARIWPD
jgi:Uma2 family endonuclease